MLIPQASGKCTVLVTGASGFVGRHVCEYLHNLGFDLRIAVRSRSMNDASLPSAWQRTEIGNIGPDTAWDAALSGVEAVIHLASHSPAPGDSDEETAAAYRRVNIQGTESLVRAAEQAGVRRLVYLSTIKVNGESTPLNKPFTETSPARPQDIYGESKWQAERILQEINESTGLKTVILRSPLVYGPKVRANFLALLRLVDKGVPIPLRNVGNRRSMLYVGNLADAIARCLDAPAAGGQTYLLSDGEDVSTPELIERIALHLGRSVRLWPMPVGLLRGMARLLGKGPMIERLTGSLVVDSQKIRRQLAWTPPFSLDEGLQATAQWYLAERSKPG